MFLLTRPSRGVTEHIQLFSGRYQVSTHTPLAGRDDVFPSADKPFREFLLTRPSRGVTKLRNDHCAVCVFLLTRPSRGVT